MLGFVWDRVNGWGTRKLVGLYDILGVQINPATEDKQDDIISAINSLSGGGATTLTDGRQVVAVTNTAIAIGSGACKTVFITALVDNSNPLVIGGSGVIYTEATRTGKLMYPGDALTISIDNLSKIYINGEANDGVTFAVTN